jgi:hypothetical protein
VRDKQLQIEGLSGRNWPEHGLPAYTGWPGSWCGAGALIGGARIWCVKHRRRLRRLVPDAELVRRRAANEPLRRLASDYGVEHTTLLRYFERPEVGKQLKLAARQLRAEQGGAAIGRGRRLRRLVPDAELVRRRAAGEPLRLLASDYGVEHTTLLRYFQRPGLARQLKQAGKQLRAERRAAAARRSAERRKEQEVRRRAREQVTAEREQARRVAAWGELAARRRPRSPYEAWLDERDARLPLTRADLRTGNDETAARVVAAGGGLQAVIDATGLRTRENVLNLIDPVILKQAFDNDARKQPQPSQ